MKINPCNNCDSTSMEMCLLIRHCKYWAIRNMNEESNKTENESNVCYENERECMKDDVI